MGQLHQRIEYVNEMRTRRLIEKVETSYKDLPLTAKQLAKVSIKSKEPSHSVYDWKNNQTSL